MILNKKINTNNSFPFLLCTFSLIFLSHFIMIFFSFNSLSIPLFFVSSVISILFLDEIFKFELNFKYKFFIILFLVIIILGSAHSFLFYSDSKPIKSLLLLPIFLNSIVIFNFFKNFTFAKILNLFKFLFIVSLIFLWVHFFYDTQLFNYSQIAVFPFREASHFALAFGAICVPLIVFTSLRFNLVIMFNLHFFAIYLPSFTFLIFGLICFLIFLFKTNINILLKFSLIIILIIPFFNFNEFINIDYFISRTPFVDPYSNEQSFSLLIFKQGWEFIYLNLINSNFLGLGFQMMGSEKMHFF